MITKTQTTRIVLSADDVKEIIANHLKQNYALELKPDELMVRFSGGRHEGEDDDLYWGTDTCKRKILPIVFEGFVFNREENIS